MEIWLCGTAIDVNETAQPFIEFMSSRRSIFGGAGHATPFTDETFSSFLRRMIARHHDDLVKLKAH